MTLSWLFVINTLYEELSHQEITFLSELKLVLGVGRLLMASALGRIHMFAFQI